MQLVVKGFKPFLVGVGVGILATILIAVVGSYLLARKFSTAEELEKNIGVPSFPSQLSADYNWSVKAIDGRTLNLSEVKGKVVFLNFWATWCAPCTAEMPGIQRLYEKMKDGKVVFVCVSQEGSEVVGRFVKEKGFTFPVYTLPHDPPPVFKVDIVPTTYILSPDGKIAYKHVGFAKWDDQRTIEFIQSLVR